MINWMTRIEEAVFLAMHWNNWTQLSFYIQKADILGDDDDADCDLND